MSSSEISYYQERVWDSKVYNTSELILESLDSSVDVFSIFRRSSEEDWVCNNSRFRRDPLLNNCCLRTVRGMTAASDKYRDVALYIHSFVHYDDSCERVMIDSVLDVVLCYLFLVNRILMIISLISIKN